MPLSSPAALSSTLATTTVTPVRCQQTALDIPTSSFAFGATACTLYPVLAPFLSRNPQKGQTTRNGLKPEMTQQAHSHSWPKIWNSCTQSWKDNILTHCITRLCRSRLMQAKALRKLFFKWWGGSGGRESTETCWTRQIRFLVQFGQTQDDETIMSPA